MPDICHTELGDMVVMSDAAEDIFLDADVLEVPGDVPDGHVFSFEYTHAATSDIVQEPVVVLLIHEAADPDGDKRVRKHECVEPQRGNSRLDDDFAEIADEQVCSIVVHIAAKELGEHEPHDQQHHKRREQAPHRAEDCTLVFLFEVAFHQFLKKELVTLEF